MLRKSELWVAALKLSIFCGFIFFYNTMTSKKNIFDFLALNCCKVREKSVKHFSRVPQKVDFVTMVLGQFFFFTCYTASCGVKLLTIGYTNSPLGIFRFYIVPKC